MLTDGLSDDDSPRRAAVRRVGAAAAALLLASALPVGAAFAQQDDPGSGESRGSDKVPKGSEQAFTVSDPDITESSGLATSTVHDGITYTVNDSGSDAQIYMLDSSTGQTEATLLMRLVEPVDWESISSGPDSRIWVGDIGDNQSSREHVTLYRFIEPDSVEDQRLIYGSYDFAYPDGAHDAEALLVHPQTGRVYIVTKGLRGGAIYRGPEDASSDGINELEKIGKAPEMITGGDFLPDGSAMILRGYGQAYVVDFPSLEQDRKLALPPQELGESVTVRQDGEQLLVGAEGENSEVWQVPVDGPPPSKVDGGGDDKKKGDKKDDGSGGGQRSGEDESDQAASGGGRGPFAGLPAWASIGVVLVALAAGAAAFPVGKKKTKRRPPRVRTEEDPWAEPWSPPRPPASR